MPWAYLLLLLLVLLFGLIVRRIIDIAIRRNLERFRNEQYYFFLLGREVVLERQAEASATGLSDLASVPISQAEFLDIIASKYFDHAGRVQPARDWHLLNPPTRAMGRDLYDISPQIQTMLRTGDLVEGDLGASSMSVSEQAERGQKDIADFVKQHPSGVEPNSFPLCPPHQYSAPWPKSR